MILIFDATHIVEDVIYMIVIYINCRVSIILSRRNIAH